LLLFLELHTAVATTPQLKYRNGGIVVVASGGHARKVVVRRLIRSSRSILHNPNAFLRWQLECDGSYCLSNATTALHQ
jgi:hypothetical protein